MWLSGGMNVQKSIYSFELDLGFCCAGTSWFASPTRKTKGGRRLTGLISRKEFSVICVGFFFFFVLQNFKLGENKSENLFEQHPLKTTTFSSYYFFNSTLYSSFLESNSIYFLSYSKSSPSDLLVMVLLFLAVIKKTVVFQDIVFTERQQFIRNTSPPPG